MKRLLSVTLLFISVFAFSQPKYEFRAVWMATVDNIDWPSGGNYTTEFQTAEFIRQLDMHQRNGMNAMIVQVRPACDAFTPLKLNPEPVADRHSGKSTSPVLRPLAIYDRGNT
jgi:uncharacterized lipoprotein YddW (UPF0748 family)